MPDTTRLVAKLDDAIRALKPQRRSGCNDGTRLAEALRERFRAGRPFEVTLDGRPYPVRCDDVRVSKTCVDLGLKGMDGTIPLTRVTTCEHGRDDDGNPIMGLALINDDDSLCTIVV